MKATARVMMDEDQRGLALPAAAIDVEDGYRRHSLRVDMRSEFTRARVVTYEPWALPGATNPDCTLIGCMDDAGMVRWSRAMAAYVSRMYPGVPPFYDLPLERELAERGAYIDALLALYFQRLAPGGYTLHDWPDPPARTNPGARRNPSGHAVALQE